MSEKSVTTILAHPDDCICVHCERDRQTLAKPQTTESKMNFVNTVEAIKPLGADDIKHMIDVMWKQPVLKCTLEFHCAKDVVEELSKIETPLTPFGSIGVKGGIPVMISPWLRPGEWAIMQDGKLVWHSSWRKEKTDEQP